ncbi:MAG: hypothetical protein N4A49_15675 [Marinifilaceae bacterium]|jgi:acetyl-CoA C-acetyltransferase/acetyl-CoA acyltransferase|nr:hypothetical protein [Marinifilaceae bacterium]
MRSKVFIAGTYNSICMGQGRDEFNLNYKPKTLLAYMEELVNGVSTFLPSLDMIDEAVVGNFMSTLYNKQANLAAFIPAANKKLESIPVTSVEGACASGGLALTTAIKSILSETSDVVLVLGLEIQNTVAAIYGADYLAYAADNSKRKSSLVHYFPSVFSDRYESYKKNVDVEILNKAMVEWYYNAITNARECEKAQEYHNTIKDLRNFANTSPNPKFTKNLNYQSCSKISDAGSAVLLCSEKGLDKIKNCRKIIEIAGFGLAVSSIKDKPTDYSQMLNSQIAVERSFEMASISPNLLSLVELHDCFSIAGIMQLEAIGISSKYKACDYILEKGISKTSVLPINYSGGLIGWGHPVGATGVRQAVSIYDYFNSNSNHKNDQYALSLNMGGDDKIAVSIVYKNI